MRVILEGCDNSGKTTLANKLINSPLPPSMRIEYFHPGGPPANHNAEISCMVEQRNKLGVGGRIVMDRITSISQQVYNPHELMNKVRQTYLNELLQVHPIIVYCRPSTDRLLRLQDLTWREGETEEHKQKIIAGQHTFVQRYDELMSRTPHICFNFEDENAVDLVELLKRAFYDETAHGKVQTLMHHQKVY